VVRVSFLHTISPIALKGKERVKEMINTLPDYDREKALELLLEEKIVPDCKWPGVQQHTRHRS
jgi:hypothetical protein